MDMHRRHCMREHQQRKADIAALDTLEIVDQLEELAEEMKEVQANEDLALIMTELVDEYSERQGEDQGLLLLSQIYTTKLPN